MVLGTLVRMIVADSVQEAGIVTVPMILPIVEGVTVHGKAVVTDIVSGMFH